VVEVDIKKKIVSEKEKIMEARTVAGAERQAVEHQLAEDPTHVSAPERRGIADKRNPQILFPFYPLHIHTILLLSTTKK